MIEALLPSGTSGGTYGLGYRPVPAVSVKAISEGRPLPAIGAVGTGGLQSESYFRQRKGYQQFVVWETRAGSKVEPFVDMMNEVKMGFGRTMNRLPVVFGVSRQTLYNWLDGETPRLIHQEKLEQLAAAVRIFTAFNFKPTPQVLERTVSEGKSLLQLLRDGSDGQEAAQKLIRITTRSMASRAKLDELLGGRKSKVTASDFATPTFPESA